MQRSLNAEDATMTISFRGLFAILEQVERTQSKRKSASGRPAKRFKLHSRSPSQVEQSHAQDEAALAAGEKVSR